MRVYKVMSQNGARKNPICEKRFKNWMRAEYEMYQHARQLKMFRKTNIVKEYVELVWEKNFRGEIPTMLAKVEFQHEGYQFRYWIEIVEK